MNFTANKPAPLTVQQLQDWIVRKLAEALTIYPEEIDVNQPFSEFGLDSVAALHLTGELEELVGRTLPATLLWDYPSITALAKKLARG